MRDGFDALLASATAEIAAIPGMAPHMDRTPIARMAAAIAMSRCAVALLPTPDSTAAVVAIAPDAASHEAGCGMADALHRAVGRIFGRGEEPDVRRIFGLGFADTAPLTAALVAAEVAPAHVSDLFERTGAALVGIGERIEELRRRHMRAVVSRDLGFDWRHHAVTDVANWALCHHLDGTPERADAIRRRMQALDAYGAIASTLTLPDVTDAIDAGRELAPMLIAHLGIDRARLSRINGMVGAQEAVVAWEDRRAVVDALAVHDVAVHRWDAEIRNEAWRRHDAPLEPAFVDTTAKRDALSAFLRDVARPLAAARVDAGGVRDDQATRRFVATAATAKEDALPERIAWNKAVTAALVGDRGAKAYAEAVEKWHRRVASISALRLEHTAPQPGWPALCDAFATGDGLGTFTPITTAEGLVDEGNAMAHCVGGYYPQCRTGRTHILSYARGGERSATLEILMKPKGDGFTLRAGQFEGRRRTKPDGLAFEHLSELMNALGDPRRGMVDDAGHLAYAIERANAAYEWDRSDLLPIEYTRLAWPLYLPLMPRGTPATFDEWAATTPLAAEIDRRIGADGTTDERRAA